MDIYVWLGDFGREHVRYPIDLLQRVLDECVINPGGIRDSPRHAVTLTAMFVDCLQVSAR